MQETQHFTTVMHTAPIQKSKTWKCDQNMENSNQYWWTWSNK